MNTVASRRRTLAPICAPIAGPAVVIQAKTPSEIAQVLLDATRYPAPVRPMGSGSSTTRCIAANGGTLLDLSAMNRVLRIDTDRVTVQPGISLSDLAQVLSKEGLELIGGLDLASRTVGGAVCAAGLEASMAGDVGQFAAHVLQLKVLSPAGKKFVINETQKSLLGLMRLSYGLLGVVYEITLRVQPVQGFSVQTAKVSFKDFAKLGAKLPDASAGVKMYLLPFRDRIYFELRRPGADGDPGKKFAWRLKDWAVNSALPGAAHSLGKAVPIKQLRYPLIDSLSEVAQVLINNALVRNGSNALEQSGRHRLLGGNSRFRLNRDRSALLSPSFDAAMFTISALSTQTDGWEDFALDFAEFATHHRGTPFFNQTKNATPEIVAQRFGPRLAFFSKARRELDPEGRMLNRYFATYMSPGVGVAAGE